MKFINSIKIDVFSPYIIIFALFLYIVLAIPAFYYNIRGLKQPSIWVFIYIILGSIFFTLGIQTPNLLIKTRLNSFNFLDRVYVDYKNLKDKFGNISISPKYFTRLELIILIIVLMGLLLQSINILNSGGIPLFSGYLKAKAVTKIWVISYLLFLPGINVLLAKFNRKWYYILFVVGMGIFALTGYRTTTIVILLSGFITLYYTRNFKWSYYLAFITGLLILGLLVGYVAVKSIEWQQWSLNPFELIFYRAGYTLTVFDKLLELPGATQGKLFYYSMTGFFQSADPRAIVGEVVLGYKHSTTSTIFGPSILDFGAWAMFIQMFLLGLILQLCYVLQKLKKGIYTAFYAVILAQTLVWIETGPTDLVVWLFYVMALVVMSYGLIKYANDSEGASNS
ncbi:oligosaccharide repeat unit polymerase family protein [Methanobacterium alcaliphilum]|uniref:oligosaccharide repeat unit polymerase family protein n=1 Tax=Methanobacterium alcaliphilum TaxID=392018 RepID=UPI00200B91B7|nr:oligosaccharide repeat unit polymerase family protein [Methanobacterium alcaliphilum]MCK9151173.1 oligosaccharide repeat unit polymerase family protein [Methanobacterium alcaliphilum]